MFVSHESQLSTVDDVFNGILVTGDATGEVLFYGKGAGKLPTASAVISDVIDCAKSTDTIDTLYWEQSDPVKDSGLLCDWSQLPAQYYLRLALQTPSQSALVDELFCSPVLLARKRQPATELAFVAPSMAPATLDALCDRLQQEGISVLGRIRLL